MRTLNGVLLSLVLFLSINAHALAEPTGEADERSGAGEKPQPIAFKQESTHQSSATFVMMGILAALGCAGTVIFYLKGRNPLQKPADKQVRVIEKTVLSHGLLAIVVEVQNETFLVVQDKNKHTVTKLNVAHEEQ